MDPREQAEALLIRARARSGLVVTPDNMVSPMDASNTQQIPGSVVSAIDAEPDPDTTTVLPSAVIEQHVHHLAEPNPTTPLDDTNGHGPWPGESAAPEAHGQDFHGLIPTKTNQPGRSDLQSRLEGRY